MKMATLSPVDAFDFVHNRFGNTRGKADSNLALDLIIEHRIREAKIILGRLGANFSPGIAQAYTRALDDLTRLSNDLRASIDGNVHTSRHADPDRHQDVLSLAKFLERKEVFKVTPGRQNDTNTKFTSIYKVHSLKLEKWVRGVLRKLATGTSIEAEAEEEAGEEEEGTLWKTSKKK